MFPFKDTIRNCYRRIFADLRIKIYQICGGRPGVYGYSYYRERVIKNILNEGRFFNFFLDNKPLPHRFGLRLDERVIEYPWIFARLRSQGGMLLDAGSALNHEYLLDLAALKSRSVFIYNITVENIFRRNNVSYIYGDLRDNVFKDEFFNEIICISTLEHIGMDNTLLYSKDERLKEFYPDDYIKVIKEFRRVLKTGGKLFITIPFGRYENLGWLQQFDYQRIRIISDTFGGSSSKLSFFKYSKEGWQISEPSSCVDCSYFDLHKAKKYNSDYVVAARAVACMELIK